MVQLGKGSAVTADRRVAAALLVLEDDDLRDTIAFVVEGLSTAERRRLLNRLRMREERAQNAHETPTGSAPNAHVPPPESPAPVDLGGGRPQDAHGTPTGRPPDAHKGGKGVSPSFSSLPLSLPLPLPRTSQDMKEPSRAGAGAREAAPELPDGGHPEDADHRLFGLAVERAYLLAQRSGGPFPKGVMGYRDQQRLREAWPRIHAAAAVAQVPIAEYIESRLGAFLAGSSRATWVLWLLDPTAGSGRATSIPTPHEEFDGVDDSDEGVAKLVGAK